MTEGPSHSTPAEAVFSRTPELPFNEEVNEFLNLAIPDALTRIPKDAGPEVHTRIINGLIRRFGTFADGDNEVARQLQKTEAQKYIAKKRKSDVKFAAVICSDRRKRWLAIGDPEADTQHRRPRGVPELTESSSYPDERTYVMGDYEIAGSISSTAEDRIEKDREPAFLEMIVGHIDCGAGYKIVEEELKKDGLGLEDITKEELEFRSIEGFFDKVRGPISGFNTDIETAGGYGNTVIAIFDPHSQGLILGLEHIYDEKLARGEKLFDRNKTIDQNFEEWEEARKIVMTEKLDQKLLEDNPDLRALKKHIDADNRLALDIKNPKNLAKDVVRIGKVKEVLTKRYETSEEGFTWIPEKVREDMPANILYSLAEHMIHNSVYRILGGIEPGNHDQLHHSEQSTRIGPKGGSLNEKSPAFIISTPGGELRKQDKEAYQILRPLSIHVAEHIGINLEQEARVVTVTEIFDKDKYNPEKPEVARKELHMKRALVKHNAREIRRLYPEDVADGRMVVVAALYDNSGKMIEVVTSRPQPKASLITSQSRFR